jgi:predicted Zn-dependent peptidase
MEASMSLYKQDKAVYYFQNRLKVVHLKRPGFIKTYVALVFPVGGLHRAYQDDSVHTFPAGAAHFLEHKCFEKDGQEVTDIFSAQGASANAFTSYQNTAYVFETINQLEENIETLLKMCFYPQFTDAGVKKEKGIIVQEWAMYQDNPFYRQYQTMQNHLYQDHPYALDILGEKESIEAMDLATLNAIHEAYYQPEIATLFVAGDGDLAPVLKALEKRVELPPKTPKKPVPIKGAYTPINKDLTLEDDVQDAYVVVGFRLPYEPDKTKRYLHYLALDIALDSVFGSSSSFYEDALDSGLISDNFFTEISFYEGVYDVSMATQTKDPKRFLKAIDTLIQTPAEDVLDQDLFKRLKKANIGSSIFGAESLEGMTRSYIRYLHDEMDEETLLTMQEALSFEAVLNAYQTFQSCNARVSVTLTPQKDPLK